MKPIQGFRIRKTVVGEFLYSVRKTAGGYIVTNVTTVYSGAMTRRVQVSHENLTDALDLFKAEVGKYYSVNYWKETV